MGKKRMLVIDDNPVILRLSSSLLTALGHEVVTAENGVEGLNLAELEQPDLIFLDIILPQMHGFEVCKTLKENKRTAKIPVVIVSGTGLEEVAASEPNLKADAILSKPFGKKDLEDVIKKVLG